MQLCLLESTGAAAKTMAAAARLVAVEADAAGEAAVGEEAAAAAEVRKSVEQRHSRCALQLNHPFVNRIGDAVQVDWSQKKEAGEEMRRHLRCTTTLSDTHSLH